MKHTTRLLASSLSLGLLVAGSGVSRAISFTTYMGNQTTGPRDWIKDGALTNLPGSPPATQFVNRLLPDGGIGSPVPVGTGVVYTTPSVIAFGNTITLPVGPPVAGSSATFQGLPVSSGGLGSSLATIQFRFDLQNGVNQGNLVMANGRPVGSTAVDNHIFEISGYLQGDVGITTVAPLNSFSSTRVVFTKLNDLDQGLMTTSYVTNPNNGLQSLFLHVKIDTTEYDVYLNAVQDISAPIKSNLSISGYVGSAVPEPGSLALFAGTGVTGLFLYRRRRRA